MWLNIFVFFFFVVHIHTYTIAEDDKKNWKDAEFIIFIYHLCMDSTNKLIMQNGFFDHTEATQQVSALFKKAKKLDDLRELLS